MGALGLHRIGRVVALSSQTPESTALVDGQEQTASAKETGTGDLLLIALLPRTVLCPRIRIGIQQKRRFEQHNAIHIEIHEWCSSATLSRI